MPEAWPNQDTLVADTLRTAQREIIPTVQEMLASTRDHKLTEAQIQELLTRFHLERKNLDLLNQSAIAQTALETQVRVEWVREHVEKSNWLKEKYPEFAGLIDAYPDRLDEWEKRIELSLAVKATEEKWYFIGTENKKDFEEVLHQLATNPDTSYFQNTRMSTNVTGAGRLSYSLEQNYTLVEFLLRVSNQTSTVVDLFWGPKIETSPEEQEKIQRLKTFMASFEGVLDDTDYREEFVKMYQSLNAWDLEGALRTMEKFVHDEYDISLRDVVGSDYSLFDALRSIGDTKKAGEIWLTTIQQSALKDKNNSLWAVITSSMEAKKQEKTTEATKKYNTILTSLEGHPMYYEFEKNKNAHIQEIGNILALTDIVDGYIKEHGTENLWLLWDWYDDMKWLSGFFNFSDENAKMTKETGIMLASFVATAGVGAFFSIVAAWARWVQVASMTTRAARTGGFINGVKNVGSLTVAGVALTWAKIFETGATGINLIKGIWFVGDTLIFTTSESMLKLMTQVPWDRQQSLLSFGEHLIKNWAMFGLFAWAGKLTEWLIAKYPQLLWSTQFARFGTLASGDLSAMYVLHCIETWEFTMTPEDWAMLGAQVVWFRGLMKGIEAMYPKTAQILQQETKRWVVPSEAPVRWTTSSEIPVGWTTARLTSDDTIYWGRYESKWQKSYREADEYKVWTYAQELWKKVNNGEVLTDPELKDLLAVMNREANWDVELLKSIIEYWNNKLNKKQYVLTIMWDKLAFVEAWGGRVISNPLNIFSQDRVLNLLPQRKMLPNPNRWEWAVSWEIPAEWAVSWEIPAEWAVSWETLSTRWKATWIGVIILWWIWYYAYTQKAESHQDTLLPLVWGELPDRVSETPNSTTWGEWLKWSRETPTTWSEFLNLPDAIAYNKRYTKNQIKLIQEKLWVNDDGIVWTTTVNAIIDFQKQYGLLPDGKAGPLTLGKMIGVKGKWWEVVAEWEKWKFARVSHASSTHRQWAPRPLSTVPREDAWENQHEERNPEPEVVSENPDRERIYEELKQWLKELKVRFKEIGSFRLDIDMACLWDKSEVYIDEKAQIFFSSSKIKNWDGKIIPFQASTSGDTLYYLNVINQIVRKRDDLARAQRDANAESSFDFSPHQKVNHIEAELDALYRDLWI